MPLIREYFYLKSSISSCATTETPCFCTATVAHTCAKLIAFNISFVLTYSTTNAAKKVSPAPETSLTTTSSAPNTLLLNSQPCLPLVTINLSFNLSELVDINSKFFLCSGKSKEVI